MEQKPNHILVPVNVANATLEYLKKKPYEEVVQLIQALTQCPLATTVPAEKKP